jgi:hypothetical protein
MGIFNTKPGSRAKVYEKWALIYTFGMKYQQNWLPNEKNETFPSYGF